MASNFNHNKKRNSSLVYEFLVRQMARQLLEKDARGYQRTVDIARRYFGASAYLSRELELFNIVRASRGLPETAARRVLKEVLEHAARLDRKQIEIKKSNLIKEVNYSFGREFFSKYRVPEYRLLASLQLLINSATVPGSIQERIDNILQLEEGVIKYMALPEGATQQPDRPHVDRLVLSLASKKFQERYGQALSEPQKKLLDHYARSIVTGDSTKLASYMTGQLDEIEKTIQRSRTLNEVRSDSVMRERLDEAGIKIAKLRGSVDGDTVQELMLFQKLAEELTNE